MRLITRKSEINVLLASCLESYKNAGLSACIKQTHQNILLNKVKFPLLEHCAASFYSEITYNQHIQFCDAIEALKTEGGNVLLGIFLQKRLSTDYKNSLKKATQYIAAADVWYVCDIIGERVFGYALLTTPEKTLPEIKNISTHASNWVIRSLGAGIHYAIKKGLEKEHVVTAFQLLLTMASTTNKEIRQGVGWAAKTTAKFHPDIIESFTDAIESKLVANWFRKKIEIGLRRNNYAKRN